MEEIKASIAITKILADSTLLPIEQQQILGKILDTIYEPDEDKKCKICAANVERDTHTLTKVMVRALVKTAKAVHYKMTVAGLGFTEANDIRYRRMPGDMKLELDEGSNWTKLHFHALVARVKEDGKAKQGRWLITRKGWAFLRGEPIPAKVTTFRGNIVDKSTEVLTIGEVLRDGAYSDTLETINREIANLPEDLR